MLAIIGTYRKTTHIQACLDSLNKVTGITQTVIVDDSGDDLYRNLAVATYKHRVIPVATHQTGYQAAMQTIWATAQGHDHVFLIEEDFTIEAPINLNKWADYLNTHPNVAQVVAQRQPWYPNEIKAGSILAATDDPGELVDGLIQHRAFFSCNPTVIPARTLAHQWPAGAWSESQLAQQLLTKPDTRFALTPNIITHHHGTRQGHGY